tara:strand:- start:242 stop:478 length:237 start_codon:yes stop_codon:yes gene_type:complete
MQELKQYVANKRKQRSFQHYELNKVHGECQPFTDREYKQVKLRGKTSYTQSSKYTMHKMWRENTQKYDFNQLKIINKA